ncbi:hypothetical protein LRS10_22745 [Phenylobacterium sp. J426]|uniref:O-antigen ligase family protein n=1 Tax=Phenylobacterium sp. J426 TaxID=2898439 RepID=UPI002150B8A6|nr:O-antigen ligase family protein [Phenylobacterium sp. J426]MCR5876726.1 hypothetical protein [Phenylobacterium sp. J426]
MNLFFYQVPNPDFALLGLVVDLLSFLAVMALTRYQKLDIRPVLVSFVGSFAILTLAALERSTERGVDFILFQDFITRNAYGVTALVGVALAAAAYAVHGRLGHLLTIIIFLFGVTISFSKTSWLVAPIIVIVALLVRFDLRRALPAVAIAATAAVIVAMNPQITAPMVEYADNYSRTQNVETLSRRAEIWDWAQGQINRTAMTQILGSGYNAGANFDLGSLGRIYSLHSDFWTTYHATGLVGLALTFCAWGVYVRRVAGGWGRAEAALPATLAVMILARGFTETNFGSSTPTHFLFWLGLGLALALTSKALSQTAPDTSRQHPTEARHLTAPAPRRFKRGRQGLRRRTWG